MSTTSSNNHSDEIFLIKRDIVLYLDKYDKISDLENKINDYHQRNNHKKHYNVFFCCLEIDIHLAADISSRLSNVIINEPLLFRSLVEDIVLILFNTLLNPKKNFDNQISVHIVPNFIPYSDPFGSKGLVTFSGILTEHSVAQKYVRSTVWKCKLHPSEYIFHKNMSKAPIHCPECEMACTESINDRQTGDYTEAYFIDPESLSTGNAVKFYEAKYVEIKDFLVNLKLGSIYKIIGVFTNNCFNAWNCEVSVPRPVPIQSFRNIMELKSRNSSWSFVFSLAMQIGVDIYPAFSFMHLKLGLLLSLATFNLENYSPVPILAVGSDTLTAHRLFNSAAQFVDRCVFPMHGAPLNGQLRKENWYEAGPLQLAQNGICFLGDWEKYTRDKDTSIIRSVIESGQIKIENSITPLQSTIWTYWCRPSKNKHLNQLQTLINIFGLPFLTDPKSDEESIINTILTVQLHNEAQPKITNSEIRQFLNSVNSIRATLDESAQQMIKDYFVASRRARLAGSLPLQALNFVTSLSKAHAKINLRDLVNLEDVVIVIYLYEESMKSVFGNCAVSNVPDVNIADLSEVDMKMKEFMCWLGDYVSNIG